MVWTNVNVKYYNHPGFMFSAFIDENNYVVCKWLFGGAR